MTPDDITPLVRGRIEQATESLADAKTLLGAARGGRSIVNRFYYCMFYCVLALLQTINRVPRKHQGAISLFDLEFVHKGLFSDDLSAELHRIFEFRHVTDYERLEEVSLEDARAAIEAAERFLATVQTFLTEKDYLPKH